LVLLLFVMKKVIRMAELKGARYVEAVRYNASNTWVGLDGRHIREMSSGMQKKYAVRVFYKGKLGTACSSEEDYKNLVDHAIKNAKSADVSIPFAKSSKLRKSIITESKIDPAEISLSDKKDDLLELERSAPVKVSNLCLSYADILSDYEFYNSEGSELFWRDSSIGLVAHAFAKRGQRIENYFEVKRLKGGYELMDSVWEIVDKAVRKAVEMLDAKNAKGGFFDVVADPKLGGVFAHEAVGHACEADLVLNHGSILDGKMNKKIGSSEVTIIDDGSLKEWGWTPFDSEGSASSRTVLIRKGVLKDYLHSRETAAKVKTGLTGNGRSQDPSFKVIPRMTNTFIDKGDSSVEEMLGEIKEGYYLKGSLGGQVDTAGGEFLFNAKEGYFVKNGEIQHMVKGVSLVGNVLETLHSIQLVGKDLKFGSGYCGKSGQRVPVSDGSPHILIRNAKVGGSE